MRAYQNNTYLVKAVMLGTALLLWVFPANAKKIKLTGEALVEIGEDFVNKKSHTFVSIKDKASGKIRRLKFPPGKSAPDTLMSGNIITAGGELAESGEISIESLEIGTVAAATVTMATTPARKVAIVHVNYLDGTNAATTSAVTTAMFGAAPSVNDAYKTISYGQISFNGDANADGRHDVFGPVTVNVRMGEGCDSEVLYRAKDEALAKAGIVASNYQHIMLILPSYKLMTGCTFSAYGQINNPVTWIMLDGGSTYFKALLQHELGHNLGLHHASTDPENDGTTNNVYGDMSDPMALSNLLLYFNAPKSYHKGFFNGFSVNPTVNALNGSIVRLSPIEDHPLTAISTTRIVRVPKPNTSEYYYFSIRRQKSYVSSLAAPYINTINVHRSSSSGAGVSHFIKSLPLGGVFSDASNGITVTASEIAADGSYATLRVGVACASAPATVTAASHMYVAANGTRSFAVRIKNNDAPSCNPTKFNVSAALPPALSGVFSPSSLIVNAGTEATTTLSLTSTAFAGSTPINILAIDSDGISPLHANASAAVTVVADTLAPTAVTLSGSIRSSTASLSWTASSDSMSGVAKYEVYEVLTTGLVLRATVAASTRTWSGSQTATSTIYKVRAVDSLGNKAVLSNGVTLVAGSVSNKGRKK